MTAAILLLAAEHGGWEWKDFLALPGMIITAIISVYTVRLSRKTTLDTSEGSAYARADKINEQAFVRLQREIDGLRQEAERRDERHQRESEQCDRRIDELERRVDQLVRVIRDAELPVPPAQV